MSPPVCTQLCVQVTVWLRQCVVCVVGAWSLAGPELPGTKQREEKLDPNFLRQAVPSTEHPENKI